MRSSTCSTSSPGPVRRLRSRRPLPERLRATDSKPTSSWLGGGVGRGDGRAEKVGTESGLGRAGPAAATMRKIWSRHATRSAGTWQMLTIEYDFNQPRGFEPEYEAADGTLGAARPIIDAKVRSDRALHRRRWSTTSRLPPRARRCRRSDRGARRATSTTWPKRGRRGIRVEIDYFDDLMQKRIRTPEPEKVRFMMIAGDDDVAAGAVSFRYRDGHQDNAVPVDEAIARVARRSARGRRSDGGRVPTRSPRTGWVRPTASTGCGRRTGSLHPGGEQVGRRDAGGVPVLPGARWVRRGRAGRAPG